MKVTYINFQQKQISNCRNWWCPTKLTATQQKQSFAYKITTFTLPYPTRIDRWCTLFLFPTIYIHQSLSFSPKQVQNQRMRTITNLFLLNLAVSDLLLGVLCMPFTLIGALLRDFVFGELMCKLLPFLQGEWRK